MYCQAAELRARRSHFMPFVTNENGEGEADEGGFQGRHQGITNESDILTRTNESDILTGTNESDILTCTNESDMLAYAHAHNCLTHGNAHYILACAHLCACGTLGALSM